MRDSIARKVVIAAILSGSPAGNFDFLFVADLRVRLLSVAVGMLAVGLAWRLARSLGRRIRALTVFVGGMLDPKRRAAALDPWGRRAGGVDPFGLAHDAPDRRAGQPAQHGMTRREAVLASMTEAVLAVDAQLSVTFCNHSFQQAVGDHGAAQGIP